MDVTKLARVFGHHLKVRLDPSSTCTFSPFRALYSTLSTNATVQLKVRKNELQAISCQSHHHFSMFGPYRAPRSHFYPPPVSGHIKPHTPNLKVSRTRFHTQAHYPQTIPIRRPPITAVVPLLCTCFCTRNSLLLTQWSVATLLHPPHVLPRLPTVAAIVKEEKAAVGMATRFVVAVRNATVLVARFVWVMTSFVPLFLLYPIARLWPGTPESDEGIATWWWSFLVFLLERSGPTAIKFGQWSSTRRDIFSAAFCNHLSQLHAYGLTHPFTHTHAMIEGAFGERLEDVFESFDETPIGSGCVGQVHRATLRPEIAAQAGVTQREVAVKVLHPRVSTIIAKDLDIMRFFARTIDRLPGMRWFGLVGSVEQFAQVMSQQLDFRIEAQHLATFAHNFRGDTTVVFPQPVYPYVAPEVLVETYEHGIPISKFIPRSTTDNMDAASKRFRRRLARIGLNAFLRMALVHRFVHGDLHPGNILVAIGDVEIQNGKTDSEEAEDGDDAENTEKPSVKNGKMVDAVAKKGEPRLILLDAGIVTELSERDGDNFFALFDAIVRNEGERAGMLMVTNAREEECDDPEAFARAIGQLVARVHSTSLSLAVVDVGDIMTKVLTLVRQHKVMIEANFASLVLGIVVMEGLGRSLDPHLDIIKASLPILARARLQRVLEGHDADENTLKFGERLWDMLNAQFGLLL